VLKAAMAGQAQVLVTNTIADFIAGPRMRMRMTNLSSHDGQPDAFRIKHPKISNGLIVALPFKAAAWLIRGERLPVVTGTGADHK
jgi:hypothetical protein